MRPTESSNKLFATHDFSCNFEFKNLHTLVSLCGFIPAPPDRLPHTPLPIAPPPAKSPSRAKSTARHRRRRQRKVRCYSCGHLWSGCCNGCSSALCVCECVDPPEEDAAQSRAIRVWIAAPETITVVTWLWPKKSVNRPENLHRKVSVFPRPKNLYCGHRIFRQIYRYKYIIGKTSRLLLHQSSSSQSFVFTSHEQTTVHLLDLGINASATGQDSICDDDDWPLGCGSGLGPTHITRLRGSAADDDFELVSDSREWTDRRHLVVQFSELTIISLVPSTFQVSTHALLCSVWWATPRANSQELRAKCPEGQELGPGSREWRWGAADTGRLSWLS